MALSVSYTFTAGTSALAAEVNQNFSDIVGYVNTNCILKDGSVAFTSIPTLPNSSPTADNHAARKKYVDDLIAATDADVAALDTELDTKAVRMLSKKTKNGGGEALLVASGTWAGGVGGITTISDFDTDVAEVNGHAYRAVFQVPSIHTNKDAILSSVPTRVLVRIRRDGTEIGRQYVSHMVSGTGTGMTLEAPVQVASATATVTWSVQVGHLYNEAGGGSDAAIRYTSDTNYPMSFTIWDMGLDF